MNGFDVRTEINLYMTAENNIKLLMQKFVPNFRVSWSYADVKKILDAGPRQYHQNDWS